MTLEKLEGYNLATGPDIVSNGLNSQGRYQCERGSLAWNFHRSCMSEERL